METVPARSDASSMSEPVRIARLVTQTRAEGPGVRTALWVQGCHIRCPGCFNPHMWAFRGGLLRTPEQLVDAALAAGTEGITLLGGEPFDQARPLATVAAGVRAAGRSVMTFSGYTTEQLASGDAAVAALLRHTDLLVAGPFLADQIDVDRPWVGSTNQEFVPLTDQGREMLRRVAATPDRLEVIVDASGAVALNGWVDLDALDQLLGVTTPRRPPRSH
jgi:anaerobic ribonucleoside-triphosphate reductase activating protein